jgi:hypothetical protein
MRSEIHNGRSLAEIVADLKEEAKEFVGTRIEMFRSELRERTAVLKVAAPLGAIGALLLTTAYLLFTLAIVALTATLFENSPYRWFFAFGIVAVVWTLFGGIFLYYAKRKFELRSLIPKRTLEVLKGDKIWIETEARNRV